MVQNFFDKNSPNGRANTRLEKSAVKNKNMLNQQLAEELHKRIIKKFEKRKVRPSISKDVYIDKLENIINKCNNRYHSLKPAEVKDNTYSDSGKESKDKDTNFKVGDLLRISKYKHIFEKVYTPNWSILLMSLMVKKFLERFMKKNYKRQIKKNLA